MVTLYGEPAVEVGVPEISPVTVFNVKPGGKSMASNDVGEFVAVIK